MNSTDEQILKDFYIDQEMNRKEGEIRKSVTPHCTQCDYFGPPYPQSEICPRCGAEMKMPKSDQATYVDDDFDETVRDVLNIPDYTSQPKG